MQMSATRTRVIEGNVTTSSYDQSTDKSYWLLKDLVGYDHHCWNAPMNYYNLEPTIGVLPKFQAEATLFSEATWNLEGDQRKATLEPFQANLDDLQLILSRMPVLQDNSIMSMSRRDELQ